MKFTAYLSGTTATLNRVEINNISASRFENATDLGAQLLAFASNPNTDPVDTPSYRIDPTDTGLRISNATGRFDLPWRWVNTISNAI
jgi:hypothetical protein